MIWFTNVIAASDHEIPEERSEAAYQAAIAAGYTDAYFNLGNLLSEQPGRLADAEVAYISAIEADPKDALALANFTGLLFGQGAAERGLEIFRRVKSLENIPLQLEFLFYEFANVPGKDLNESLASLKTLILAGIRSPGWNLRANVEQAKQAGHPEAQWVPLLAAAHGW